MLAEPYVAGVAPPYLPSFTFDLSNILCNKFDFASWKRNADNKPRKRPRAIADVDGEGSGTCQKKKRRLRLELITSRLSRPYATPTTYIVSRGSIKPVKQARPKAVGRSLLRRAAIINWMRRKKAHTYGQSLGVSRQHQVEEPSIYDEEAVDIVEDDNSITPPAKATERRNTHAPQTPSPLGLSNYDAIDMEGDPYEDEPWCETADEFLNSDFNKRDPVDTRVDNLDHYPLDFENAPSSALEPRGKDIMELVTDEDKQQEISFAQFD